MQRQVTKEGGIVRRERHLSRNSKVVIIHRRSHYYRRNSRTREGEARLREAIGKGMEGRSGKTMHPKKALEGNPLRQKKKKIMKKKATKNCRATALTNRQLKFFRGRRTKERKRQSGRQIREIEAKERLPEGRKEKRKSTKNKTENSFSSKWGEMGKGEPAKMAENLKAVSKGEVMSDTSPKRGDKQRVTENSTYPGRLRNTLGRAGTGAEVTRTHRISSIGVEFSLGIQKKQTTTSTRRRWCFRETLLKD